MYQKSIELQSTSIENQNKKVKLEEPIVEFESKKFKYK